MRHPPYRRAAVAGVLSIGLCLAAVLPALGQHISRWVDDRGVVHFSTSSPPKGVAFESVWMTAQSAREGRVSAAPPEASADVQEPAPVQENDDAAKKDDTAKKDETKMKDDAAKKDDSTASVPPSGPARLVAKLKETQQPSPSARELKGTVKNVGGAAAGNVSVSITVFEDGQGNECFHEEVTVDPSNLGPGETGKFTASFDDPCFFGEPRIDIVAEWQ